MLNRFMVLLKYVQFYYVLQEITEDQEEEVMFSSSEDEDQAIDFNVDSVLKDNFQPLRMDGRQYFIRILVNQ